ncbi:hypothetical protein SLA2020_058770 [Shorea laevis]
MATPLTCSLSVLICAQSASQTSFRKTDPGSGKRASSNWWAPLFGWSAEPDYVNNTLLRKNWFFQLRSLNIAARDPDSRLDASRRRRRSGCGGRNFAIASRLASDVSDRPEK